MTEVPSLVVAAADATPRVGGSCVKEAEPWPDDVPSPVILTPWSLRGSGFSPSQEAILDDVMSIPESSYIVDLGIGELELPGFPRAPLRPTSWRQVAGVVESTC
jgi:hypothetical protein